MPDMTEFDDLAARLVAERPDIGAEFARLLDNRKAAGFPRKRRRLSFPRVSLWMPAGGIAAAAAVVIAVGIAGSGDGSGGGDSSGGGSGAASTAAAPAAEAPAPQQESAAAGGVTLDSQRSALNRAAPAPDLSTAPRKRVQEVSTSMTIEAPPGDIGKVGDEILQVVAQVGGFVESSNVRSTDGDSGSGSFEVRIPVDRLEDGLARLSRLGHVRERTSGSQDITAERNVAREQLLEAKAVRQGLLNRLAEADTDAEVEALRAQLRAINAQIGRARASLRQVQRRAAYAQVSITLVAVDKDAGGAGGADDEWTPGDALRDAGRVLEVVAGVLVVVGAVVLPLVLLGAAWTATRRGLARRGRQRALDGT